MSMGFESMLQSTPTENDIVLEMGDIKLQYNAALDDLRVVSASFESYINACERYLALCDCIEANEGMLEPAVRDFVNRNEELASALGIDLAMEDDSQDAQKQNGEKVTEKKQGFFRRMWEGIKKFVRWILDKIGSVFHWIGNLFAGTKKKMEWVLHDGIKVAEEFSKLPKEEQETIIKEGLSATTLKKEKATEAFDLDEDDTPNRNHEFFNIDEIIRFYGKFWDALSTYCASVKLAGNELINPNSEDTVAKSIDTVIQAGKQLVSNIHEIAGYGISASFIIDPNKIRFDENTGKVTGLNSKIESVRVDDHAFMFMRHSPDKLKESIYSCGVFVKDRDMHTRIDLRIKELAKTIYMFIDSLEETRTEQMNNGRWSGPMKSFNWFTAPVKLTNKAITVLKNAQINCASMININAHVGKLVYDEINCIYSCLKRIESKLPQS